MLGQSRSHKTLHKNSISVDQAAVARQEYFLDNIERVSTQSHDPYQDPANPIDTNQTEF